jgi:hypothetical protein
MPDQGRARKEASARWHPYRLHLEAQPYRCWDVHGPFESMEALQAALDAWRREYNTDRYLPNKEQPLWAGWRSVISGCRLGPIDRYGALAGS